MSNRPHGTETSTTSKNINSGGCSCLRHPNPNEKFSYRASPCRDCIGTWHRSFFCLLNTNGTYSGISFTDQADGFSAKYS